MKPRAAVRLPCVLLVAALASACTAIPGYRPLDQARIGHVKSLEVFIEAPDQTLTVSSDNVYVMPVAGPGVAIGPLLGITLVMNAGFAAIGSAVSSHRTAAMELTAATVEDIDFAATAIGALGSLPASQTSLPRPALKRAERPLSERLLFDRAQMGVADGVLFITIGHSLARSGSTGVVFAQARLVDRHRNELLRESVVFTGPTAPPGLFSDIDAWWADKGRWRNTLLHGTRAVMYALHQELWGREKRMSSDEYERFAAAVLSKEAVKLRPQSTESCAVESADARVRYVYRREPFVLRVAAVCDGQDAPPAPADEELAAIERQVVVRTDVFAQAPLVRTRPVAPRPPKAAATRTDANALMPTPQ